MADTTTPRPYSERFRPQYHFSMKQGWINDPNGLVYHDGVYHLFCQHYPDDVHWGPMHWSHATSEDLVNWTEQPIALFPDELGTCFSGSAAVDWANTSGLGEGGRPPLLAFYTAAGDCVDPPQPTTQALAFSTDGGKTWAKFDGNPVLGHVLGGNRDPKVFWHEPTGRWVMVLYLDVNTFGLFASPDAKTWTELSRFDVPGNCECPDLFEMPVVGDDNRRKWIFLSGANRWPEGDCARYVVGSFDGVTFSPESDPIPIEEGGWNYSTQTWSDAPDGRRIFISWMSTPFGGANVLPGNPFNGQYRVAWELTLLETPAGLRLARRPVKELTTLRQDAVSSPSGKIAPGEHAIEAVNTRSVDIECVIEPAQAMNVAFRSEGVQFVCYDVASQTMRVLDREHAWPLTADGTLSLRILFDVNCVEVFAPDGLTVMSSVYSSETLEALDESRPRLSVEVTGGPARIDPMAVHPMRSIW